jgi:hypothetical protein
MKVTTYTDRCDDPKHWLVQTVSGSTITPGEVEKATQNICWEFQYVSVGLPNLSSGISGNKLDG